jgi:hypothetical protein
VKKKRRVIRCLVCRQTRMHYAKELCVVCWRRQHRVKVASHCVGYVPSRQGHRESSFARDPPRLARIERLRERAAGLPLTGVNDGQR